MITTIDKVPDGGPLSSVWDNDMEDGKRDVVLRQVVDIFLELASQRFDKILFQRESDSGIDSTQQGWYITSLRLLRVTTTQTVPPPLCPPSRSRMSSITVLPTPAPNSRLSTAPTFGRHSQNMRISPYMVHALSRSRAV